MAPASGQSFDFLHGAIFCKEPFTVCYVSLITWLFTCIFVHSFDTSYPGWKLYVWGISDFTKLSRHWIAS